MTKVISEFEKISQKRKDLVAAGEVPDWYITQGYLMFDRKYSYKGETVKGAFKRVANTLAKHVEHILPDAADKFFELQWSGKLADSSPVLSNTGTNRGDPVSCSGGYVPDSVEGFYEHFKEVAQLSKRGYGCSGYLGDIRPRGSLISAGGFADGAVPVLDMCFNTVSHISQGENRRGNYAGYFEMDTDDFNDIIGYVHKNKGYANIGFNFRDSYLEKLKAGDKEAVRRWNEVMYTRAADSKGYMTKPDHAQRLAPQAIKNSGISLKGSNMCVASETKILTDKGNIPIAELEGEDVNVWNGEEFSEVKVVKTGENQKLLKVSTDSGYELECTPYHKFYIFTGYGKPFKEVRAHELKEGDKLIKFKLPVIEGTKELDKAYINGFYSGDGCFHKGDQIVMLYHEKRKLQDLFEGGVRDWYHDKNTDRQTKVYRDLEDKFFVPNEDFTIKSRLEWLAGYLDADGCVYRNGTNEALTASSVELEFLKEIQLMLQTLGVSCKIKKFSDEGFRKLPCNDGTGELKDFWCKEAYRLLITSSDSYKLLCLGLKLNRLKIDKRLPQRDAKQFVKVVSVEDDGRYDDTYCFTEPKRNMGMFNGILTGQCSEIWLPQDENHTFSCVLSSLNLTKWDEITDEDIFYSVVFLDCVVSEMLQNTKGLKGFDKIVRFTEKSRALGLGVLGFHSYLQSKMIAFEDLETILINRKIFDRIDDVTAKASEWLADKLGEPEWCKGTGKRNATLTAIAPNTSSALLCGGVSQGIEPVVANAYNQPTAAGEMTRMNPYFVQLAKEKGEYSVEMMRDIAINHEGSVQHLEWLTDREKLVFRTAFEIDQRSIIRLASQRQKNESIGQKGIDQGQSLNLFFGEDEEYVAEVVKEAMLDENIKGLYYQRSQRNMKGSKGVVETECVNCEG